MGLGAPRYSRRGRALTTPRTIEAVLFDLHGVLTSSPWESLAAVGANDGAASQDEVLAVMLGDYASDGDHPWHRLERGEIGIGEYLPAVMALAAEAGVELDFNQLRGFSDRIVVQDVVVERVQALRHDGYRTGIVTNNIKEGAGWRSLLPVDDLFDVVVDSSEVGVRKPDPAIFAIALERLGGVRPEAAVFLDDAPGNVEGARRAGLHAIHVDDQATALSELDDLLRAG
ncbi:MAG TPA: HAD family phosphatase [Acidimicrobiales bacterium]|nr:HAD family phosphatase [Acidimicrobiales bacterium]